MSLEQRLIQANLVSPEQIREAVDRQRREGGSLAENLVATGAVDAETVAKLGDIAPQPVHAIADTGLSAPFLMTLVLKHMHAHGAETATQLAELTMLPTPVVGAILKLVRDRKLTDTLGSESGSLTSDLRYALTAAGRDWVLQARQQSEYVGPAPVPLDVYAAQVDRQRIGYDHADAAAISGSLAHLVFPPALVAQLGPAVNSGRAILLYGEPGNGKTSVALALSDSFKQTIFVPHAIEVDGQVIKVFDRSVHQPVDDPAEGEAGARVRIRASDRDRRWVRCRRPSAVVGGELTLDMLDLSFNIAARYYEAPLQVKATGGVFVIDDFGRQIAPPQKILNRWILPLENEVDFLTLHTGKKFPIPFDGLVIFSTNLRPSEIMDAAMLRRIPYNFRIGAPSEEEYRTIFERVCAANDLAFDPAVLDLLRERVYAPQGRALARFHPRAIVEHVIARCRFEGREPALDPELVLEAAGHLYAPD
ncbi:MAG: hypothetical protein EXQ96_04045 [Alphaproteobacteria bacterium]|nr:hypothetical protein [Alphaproteobacteria bacterium]